MRPFISIHASLNSFLQLILIIFLPPFGWFFSHFLFVSSSSVRPFPLQSLLVLVIGFAYILFHILYPFVSFSFPSCFLMALLSPSFYPFLRSVLISYPHLLFSFFSSFSVAVIPVPILSCTTALLLFFYSYVAAFSFPRSLHHRPSRVHLIDSKVITVICCITAPGRPSSVIR